MNSLQLETLLQSFGVAAARYFGLSPFLIADEQIRSEAENTMLHRRDNLLKYIEEYYVPREPS